MCQKWHFQCLKLLNNAKFPLLYHMVYGRKDLDLLDIFYLACCYVSLIYKFMYILKNGGQLFCSCCRFCIRQKQGEMQCYFLKYVKTQKNQNCYIQRAFQSQFKKHGLICSYFGILIYFTFLFSFLANKKSSQNSFLAYFCNF